MQCRNLKTNAMQMIIIEQNQLTEMLTTIVKNELNFLKEPAETKEDLMTREEVVSLLKVNPATLWRWQNQNKVTAYKIAHKCYYKRSEIMATINKSKL